MPQKVFASPEAAMNAFGDAIANSNETALKAMLGDQFRQLIPPVGAEDRQHFLQAWSDLHVVKMIDDKLARASRLARTAGRCPSH